MAEKKAEEAARKEAARESGEGAKNQDGPLAIPGKVLGRALSIIPAVLGGGKGEEEPAKEEPKKEVPVVEKKSSSFCFCF